MFFDNVKTHFGDKLLEKYYFPFDEMDERQLRNWWCGPAIKSNRRVRYNKNLQRRILRAAERYLNSAIDDMVCPKEGAFTAYKIASLYPLRNGLYSTVIRPRFAIVELKIPEDARRSSAFSNKCRCDRAYVSDIWELVPAKTDADGDGWREKTLKRSKRVTEAYSVYSPKFAYTIGGSVRVRNFEKCRWAECGAGIHFFMTEKEVVDYVMDI